MEKCAPMESYRAQAILPGVGGERERVNAYNGSRLQASVASSLLPQALTPSHPPRALSGVDPAIKRAYSSAETLASRIWMRAHQPAQLLKERVMPVERRHFVVDNAASVCATRTQQIGKLLQFVCRYQFVLLDTACEDLFRLCTTEHNTFRLQVKLCL